MKIRFVIMNAYAAGGTVRTTFDTASRLADEHDVEIVSVRRRTEDPAFALDKRVQLRALIDERDDAGEPGAIQRRLSKVPSRIAHPGDNRYPNFNMWSDLALARDIRGMREGVIIGTRPSINLAIAEFARPTVYAVGQEHLHVKHWGQSLRKTLAAVYPRLDAVTSLTNADRSAYRKLLPSGGPMLRTLPNAVTDVGDARSDLSSRTVVAAGRLTHQKGFDLLIEAFETVARAHPDWTLQIYGRGESKGQLQELVTKAGLQKNVQLMGFSDRLAEDMATGTIFAFSSRFEGFGLALIEAMSVGLAVVSFDCPHGPRDIVDDGVNGLLVEPKKPEALARALNELIESPEKREAFAKAGLEKAREFSAESVNKLWDDFLADLTAKRPGKRRGRLPRPHINPTKPPPKKAASARPK